MVYGEHVFASSLLGCLYVLCAGLLIDGVLVGFCL